MSQREDKLLERKSNLGMNLHTALRKCCDSDPTSLVYNLVSLESFDEAWNTYLDNVLRIADESGGQVTVDVLQGAAKALDWGNAQRNALRIAFRGFTDDDWAGFICFEDQE